MYMYVYNMNMVCIVHRKDSQRLNCIFIRSKYIQSIYSCQIVNKVKRMYYIYVTCCWHSEMEKRGGAFAPFSFFPPIRWC